MTPRKVLVGVETPDCLPALRVAAAEAIRRRCGVHLLHVMTPVYSSRPHIEELTLIAGELQRAGASVVGDAAQELRRMLPDELVVSTELCHGAVATSLVETSAHACLLVLQHGHHHRSHYPPLLSTVMAVAARAQCPLLVVPANWDSPEPKDRGCVVAGVSDAIRSAAVVHAALTEASRRHGRLLLVHGTHGVEAQETDGMDPVAQGAWLRRRQRQLERDLADLCGSRPDVAVELRVDACAPDAALLAHAAQAAVVVVGRGRGVPFLRRPGPVTTSVLRRAACPVMVVQDAPWGPEIRRRELAEVAVP
jgi:nucleotide-binding universal stress UspA family protein